MNTLNSIYTFLTGQIDWKSTTNPICNTKTMFKAATAIANLQDKFGTQVSHKDLIKMHLDESLILAKCARIIIGLQAVPPIESRTPILTTSPFEGYKLVESQNIFTIAEEIAWEKSLPGMVMNSVNRAITYINTPTGLVITTTAIAAGVLGLYMLTRNKDNPN